MKTLTIIGGVDGVGKTGMSGVLFGGRNIRVIIADDFTDEETAMRQINTAIEKEVDFALETTLSDSYILETIKSVHENNYYIRLYYIGVNTAEECIKRISNRVKKGGRNIAENIVIERFNNRLDDLLNILPYCNEAVIYDNENGFEKRAKYADGRLLIKGDNILEWVEELKRRVELL